jgi:hypothetical protein
MIIYAMPIPRPAKNAYVTNNKTEVVEVKKLVKINQRPARKPARTIIDFVPNFLTRILEARPPMQKKHIVSVKLSARIEGSYASSVAKGTLRIDQA